MAMTMCRCGAGSSRCPGLHMLLLAAGVVFASLNGVRAEQPAAGCSTSEATGASHVLIVGNLAGETRPISPQEFAALPRVSLQAKAPHSDQTATYEGVLLKRVLQEAGVQPTDPSSTSQGLSRPLRSAYLLIEAIDGYQVVFSLPEVLSEGGGDVLLADRVDGKPLDADAAPYQMVVARSATHERWIRQVRRILVQPASASPFTARSVETPEATARDSRRGGVYLVGTGPGAPDLITVRAAQVLRSADLVLCYSWMKDELDPFVEPGVVEVASPLLQGGKYFGHDPGDFSGEDRDRAARAHEELARIKARIQDLLQEGKTVVFADNGDPMIFSPWSWVPQQLAELNPTVVPGLSSFNAGNAALKRSVAGLGSVIISSGTEMGTPNEHGRLAGTVVFFTHHTKLEKILPELCQRYPADTPVRIVCDVSYPPETVIYGTLGTIRDVLGDRKLPLLYLVYVGDGLK